MERVMISCKRATELVSQQQDQKLGRWQRLVLGFHLMICSHCHRFEQQMTQLRQFARRFAQGDESMGVDPTAAPEDVTKKIE